jgi:hypothetical protein
VLQEGRDRLRRREEPHLVRQDDEVEVFVARERERLQRRRLQVRRFRKGVEEGQEGPGKWIRRHCGRSVSSCTSIRRVGAQRRDDLLRRRLSSCPDCE